MASAKSIYGNDAIHAALEAGAVMVTIKDSKGVLSIVELPTTYLGRNDDIDGLLRATVRRAHTGLGTTAGYDSLTHAGLRDIEFYTPFVELTFHDSPFSRAINTRFKRLRWSWRSYSREEIREALPRARELLKAWRKAVDQLREEQRQDTTVERMAKRTLRVERAAQAIRSFLNHRRGANPDIQRDRFAAIRVARKLEGIGPGYSAGFDTLTRPDGWTRGDSGWALGESHRGFQIAMSRGVGRARPDERRWSYEDNTKLQEEYARKRALAERAEQERRATVARQIPAALLDQIHDLAPEVRAELIAQLREMDRPKPAARAA